MYRIRSNPSAVAESSAITARTVADLIVSRLAGHTDHLFGVGGANIEDIYDAAPRTGSLTALVAKHEFGAATMADGYARATGRLGLVAATSGGGALNLLAALGESYDARTPVLALVGQPPLALEGRGVFQDTSGGTGLLDAERIFGSVSRRCEKVTRSADALPALERAIAAASAGGPAVLLLPKDVQAATAPLYAVGPSDSVDAGYPADGEREPARLGIPTVEVAARLRAATSTGYLVIIAGPEVARADARVELAAVAQTWNATVLVTPDAKDVFPNRDPRFGGVVGIMGHPHVPGLVAGASACLLIGTTLPMTARDGLDDALAAVPLVVHLGAEPPHVPVAARMSGPLRERLSDMLFRHEAAVNTAASTAAPLPELEVPPATGPGVRYREAVSALAERLDPGTCVVADAGNTGAAVVHHLPVPEGGRFLISLAMGGMGYAFGAGIGCALGTGRRTVVIAGDGAYFMHGHEVHTAIEYQAPVTFVVFNNNAHGMCVTREQLYYSADYSYNRFAPAHIGSGVAAMFPGLAAYTATTLDGFAAALDATRAVAGPVFIELLCDPDEIPPFTPFLKELSA